jgi:hypothetical protein
MSIWDNISLNTTYRVHLFESIKEVFVEGHLMTARKKEKS